MPTQVPRPNPFRAPSSSFIHPESIRAKYEVDNAPRMSAEGAREEADKAIVAFFESAITPEKDDEDGENEKEQDESAGVVEGLHCTLMKHQIEGLEFLLDHECLDENVKAKGKGKYGGLLADDVRTLHTCPFVTTPEFSILSILAQ